MFTRLTFLGALLAATACQAPRSHAKAAPSTVEQSGQMDPSAPVAVVGGQTITAGELEGDPDVKKQLRQEQVDYLNKTYEVRRQGLDQIITKRLVEKKAKEEGITPQQLVEREVVSKIPAPSDDELKSVYDKMKTRAATEGKEMPPFDQVKSRLSDYMKSQKFEEPMRAFVDKLKAEAHVEVKLPGPNLPRIELSGTGPVKGAADAPVTIVEFSDFQCPYCGRAEPTVERVLAEYQGKVKLQYREFPLPFHPFAQKASEAALCAGDQGKYWEMHDKLFAHQDALEVASLKGYAKDLGLDSGKFDQCLDSSAKAPVVEESKKAGEEAGVNGTPAFFINGKPLSGAVPYEQFKEQIDAELASKK